MMRYLLIVLCLLAASASAQTDLWIGTPDSVNDNSLENDGRFDGGIWAADSAGTLDSIVFYGLTFADACDVRFGIWSRNDSALVDSTGYVTMANTSGSGVWKGAPVVAGAAVEEGTRYMIAYQFHVDDCATSAERILYEETTNTPPDSAFQWSVSQTAATPATFEAGSYQQNRKVTIRAWYHTDGGTVLEMTPIRDPNGPWLIREKGETSEELRQP